MAGRRWLEVSTEECVNLLAPVAVYWVYAGMYEGLGQCKAVDKFRLHSKKDEETKNLVSKKDVVLGVLRQQFIQAFLSFLVGKISRDPKNPAIVTATAANSLSHPQLFIAILAQFLVAMFVFDTWQYFVHRCMHANRFLYRRLHSWHHRVIAPYAYAAQYSHPIDGLVIETLAGMAAYLVSGMSDRTATFFFVFATIKGIDDHCGLAVPWNPFQMLFSNNAAYHQVHHQLGGGRSNFAQPFFTFWDRVLGTHAEFTLEQADDRGTSGRGGFQVRIRKEEAAQD